ncbi:MAG: hypothetical protein R3C61_03030 [Bacteroidia bacterium]
MRLLALVMVALLSVQVHMGQEADSGRSQAKLRQLNNYKQWAGNKHEAPAKDSIVVYVHTSPSLKIKPDKRALFMPRRSRETTPAGEVYRQNREGRRGRIRP